MNRIVSLWRHRTSDQDFENLVAPLIEPMFRLAWRLTGSADDAEDLVQDLLVRVYPKREQLHDIERLQPWLARVMLRIYLDHRRRVQRSPVVPFQHDDETMERFEADASLLAGDDDTPEQMLEQSLTAGRLQRALQALPAEQRMVLLLHDVEGYTLPELVEMLEAPLGTLKSRLHRGRERMRGLLLANDPDNAAEGTF